MTNSEQQATDLYQLGREAAQRHEVEKAVELFRRSIEFGPHFKTLELLGELLLESQGPSSEAVVLLAAAAGLGIKQSRPLFLLATALARRGQINDALETLDRAIEIQPNYKRALELREELKAKLQTDYTKSDPEGQCPPAST